MKGNVWQKDTAKIFLHSMPQIVLAALRQDKKIAKLCHEFGLKASQIYTWRNKAIENLNEAFKKGSESRNNTISGNYLAKN